MPLKSDQKSSAEKKRRKRQKMMNRNDKFLMRKRNLIDDELLNLCSAKKQVFKEAGKTKVTSNQEFKINLKMIFSEFSHFKASKND